MHESNDQLGASDEARIPRRLQDDLTALYGGDVSVPAAVDEAVIDLARRRLAGRRRARLVLRMAQVGAAAAAAVGLMVWLAGVGQREADAPSSIGVVAAREDIDRNGAVNILDAFVLARRIKAAGEFQTAWDVNRDGAVNRADVDAVAAAAVRLEQG